MSEKRKTLSRIFLINMTLFTFFSVTVFAYFWISHEYSRFSRHTAQLRKEYIAARKERLKDEVERTVNYIRYMNSTTEKRLKALIRERVYEAHSIALNIYRENKGKRSDIEIVKMIKDALRPIRFNQGRGYFFAGDFEGIEQLFADRPEMEGKYLGGLQDTQGRYVIRDMIRIVQEKKEGFYQYFWTKPDRGGKDYPKIAFVKHFGPYDWFLGTGEYLDDMQKDIQQEAMERLIRIRFGKGGYIFGSSFTGDPLFTNGKITAGGKSVWELTDPEGKKIIQEQIKLARKPEGGYLAYTWYKLDNPELSPKISFVMGMPEWQWVIGAGAYTDEVDAVIRQKRKVLREDIENYIVRILAILCTLLIAVYLTARYMSGRIMENVEVFCSFFETAATKHIRIETGHLYYGEFEKLALSANRMIEDRRRIESALQKNEERFRSFFEHAALGIAHIETDGRYIIANESYCKTVGYTPEEITGLRFQDITHPDDIEADKVRMQEVLEGKTDKTRRVKRYIRKDGSVMWGNVGTSLVRKNSGEPDYFISVIEDVSHRKQMEDSLRISEARYRELFNNMSSGVAVYEAAEGGKDFIFKDFNSTGERIENLKKEDIIGRKVTEIFPAIKDFGLLDVLQRVWRSGKPESHPVSVYQDGRISGWRENYVYKLPTGEIVAMYDDVTDRKQAEESLRQSEERYRSLVQASPAAISIFQDGYIVFTNPAGIRLFGISDLKELGKKPGIEYIAPAYREKILERAEKLDTLKPNPSIEIEILRQDGSTVPIESVSIPIRLGDRNAALIIGQDISDRKKAEEELKKTKNYLDNILTSSPYPLIGLDTKGNISVFNPAAEKLSGIPRAAAYGKIFSEVMPDFKDCCKDIFQVLKERKPLIREKVRKEKDGGIRYYDIIIYPLSAEGPEGAVLRIDNVTERVRFEEMMIQTEKMMSVGGLAAGMAHEINNPLGGILQSAQNIRRRFSPDLAKNAETAAECGTDLNALQVYLEKRSIFKFLDGIQISGRKAADIVQNMLTFSRRSESRIAPVDLAELLDKAVELATHDYDLKKKYDFRKIEIIRDYSADLPEISCVATEIEQVVLNLLRNAAHAMAGMKPPRSQPRIWLRLRKEKDAMRIELEDNGPGMDEKVRKRIFEPFFTTKEVGDGTGLGLSVSYFIITNNHKGRMIAESEKGKGSRFIIHLPLRTSIFLPVHP